MHFDKTQVYLVGAGPGDPELVTMKAVRVLAEAEVVLYDFLVHPNLLQYCHPEAKLVCVGKRKGFHSKKQTQIHQLILKYIRQNKCVVRLKGGDPLVFGRGGEEMMFLAKHQIRYEVIPGVSSALAVPAYAGIPLTHRDWAQSVAFVTGHVQDGTDLDIPEADTLVFLMGVTTLPKVVTHLMGMKKFSAQTPTALIYRGTTADQRLVLGNLGNIVEKKEREGVSPPALLVVGEVVTLASQLGWRHTLPLSGMRVVLLRAQGQNTEWIQSLSALGAEVVALPLIQTVPNQPALNRIQASFLKRFTSLVFTSPNGVFYFMEALLKNGLDARCLAQKRLIAIGPKTAKTLKQYGLLADSLPADQVAEGILSLFEQRKGDTILLAVAQGARDVLAEGLKKAHKVTVLPLYKTKPTSLIQFPLKDGDRVVFTSSSTATHFFEHPLYQGQAIQAFCLGRITAQTVKQYLPQVWTAPEPTLEAIMKGLYDSR